MTFASQGYRREDKPERIFNAKRRRQQTMLAGALTKEPRSRCSESRVLLEALKKDYYRLRGWIRTGCLGRKLRKLTSGGIEIWFAHLWPAQGEGARLRLRHHGGKRRRAVGCEREDRRSGNRSARCRSCERTNIVDLKLATHSSGDEAKLLRRQGRMRNGRGEDGREGT